MQFTGNGDQTPNDELTQSLTEYWKELIALKKIEIKLVKTKTTLLIHQHLLQNVKADLNNIQSNNQNSE